MKNQTQPNSKHSLDGCNVIHLDTVRAVHPKIPDDPSLYNLADFFKILSDKSRLGILCALAESEMCVCDLCVLLGMKQSAASHQLKTLRQMRVVKNRRDGKVIYYSLTDDHIRKVLDVAMEHLEE
jgi:DNA-binding transcriptional ArsR family regulator